MGLTSIAVQGTTSCSLTTFDQDLTGMGNMLIRIALVKTLHLPRQYCALCLLCFRCTALDCRHKLPKLKIGALEALRAVSNHEIGAMEKVQHIAAGILLCSFELATQIYQALCTSGQWRSYIIGIPPPLVDNHPGTEVRKTVLNLPEIDYSLSGIDHTLNPTTLYCNSEAVE
ncbi:hypothetical protein PENANT_c037G04524 [Penicillium antarcticum]|uniref:Uncharacterized protein n=1 Tax=Penicillium antarcticum TaxID=416450 RepID=A0A1V6PTB0_9EURO|nr:hypothetical protein PENANT_c037G04524 [Penicillium antarcticum]